MILRSVARPLADPDGPTQLLEVRDVSDFQAGVRALDQLVPAGWARQFVVVDVDDAAPADV